MKRRVIFIIVAVVVLIAAGFIYNTVAQARKGVASAYQTVLLERGDLTAIVGATGTVRANQTTVIGWQTTGRIAALHAKLDDNVQKGQVLAELEESSLPQSVILAKADLIAARRNLEELKLSDAARAQALQSLVSAQDAYDKASTRRESKQYLRTDQDTLDIAQADYIVAEDAVTQAEIIYDRFDHLPEDNPTRAEAFRQLATARQIRDKALANWNWLLGKPDEQEIAQADADVALTKAALDDATREWERLKNGPDPNDILAAEARVAALEATLDLSYLEAPFAGVVTEVNSKVGDQVAIGVNTFRVDDLSHLLVDVDIPEVDINRIQIGQPASLTFDAVLGKEYKGIVSEVARVGTTLQGVVNFIVTVELTDADNQVRPGMTAAVNVLVNQLEDVLVVPNRAVRLVDGKRVVYVLKEGIPTAVFIEIGPSSDLDTQILSGDLKEGDLIVLNPPVQFQRNPVPFSGMR